MSEPKDYSKKAGTCQYCHKTIVAQLHRVIAQSGAESFSWVCTEHGCLRAGCFQGPYSISQAKVLAVLSAAEIEALPIEQSAPCLRCVLCGERAVEYHHWAPKAIFGKDDCENWPKDYLCKKHHDQWHKLVTPQLVGKGDAD